MIMLATAHSTRPYPSQTQITIIPPSSTHRYLPPLTRPGLTWMFSRCEVGSSPLNVIFGHDPALGRAHIAPGGGGRNGNTPDPPPSMTDLARGGR